MASRSQEPPTKTAPVPKGKASKPTVKETASTSASAPKSKTTKAATKDVPERAISTPKVRAIKTVTQSAPAAPKPVPSPEKVNVETPKPPATAKAVTETRSTKTQSGLEATVKGADPKKAVSDEQRAQWIAEAAYFIAQRRGFSGGSADEDWREAEKEINRLLAPKRR